MLFSSPIFLFVFLPALFVIYMLAWVLFKGNIRLQNTLLVIASLIFYAYGEPVFVFVMSAIVIANAILAVFMSKSVGMVKKLLLIIGVSADICILVVFKYGAFFYTSDYLSLPVGLSFFTFQILSYLIDVYRDPSVVQKNPGRVLLYVSFFPQLIAGPIVRYHDIREFISHRRIDTAMMAAGVSRFIMGLSKKVLIANPIAEITDAIYAQPSGDMTTMTAWVAAIGYTLQIYYDFSGYSDMAIGLGHIFGFSFKENFDAPYQAVSIRDFWRKWHISLSSWFKEYLYIPLGGNRKGMLRTEINKLIVFFLTGMWHGAGLNFILWGMIHGVSVVISDIWRKIRIRTEGEVHIIGKVISYIVTMFIVIVAFVWFRADGLGQGFDIFSRMIGVRQSVGASFVLEKFMTPYYAVCVCIAIIGCLPLKNVWIRLSKIPYLVSCISISAYILCIFALVGNTYNPFIYFRF